MFRTMPNNSTPRTVLIVDDDRLVRWSLAEILTADGHVVTEAKDGATALRAIHGAAVPFDVALLDDDLPDSRDPRLLSELGRVSPTRRVGLTTAYRTPAA